MTSSSSRKQSDRFRLGPVSRRQLLQGTAALGFTAPLTQLQGWHPSVLAQDGGTSVVANYAMPVDLEPGKIPSFMAWFVIQNLGEGLTTLGRNDAGELEVRPLLAESYEQSEDGLTWTFHLREGVTFHDGTELNADAIVFSHNRIMQTDHPHYNPAFAQFGDPLNSMIEEITAVDPLTVEFVLKSPPNPYFLNWEAFILAVSPAAVEELGENFGTNMVGTGPFKLDLFDAAGGTIEISRYVEYWSDGYPKLDKVIWQAVTEPSTRLAMLETGDVDVATVMPPELAERITANADLALHAAEVPNFNAISFYRSVPPFDDIRLRQAVAHALDRTALTRALYGEYWTPAINNRWPGMPGWEEYQPYPYDPDRARELLEEAGVPDLSFTLDMPSTSSGNPAGTRWGEVIQDQLSQVGITVELNVMESGSYWNAINTPRPNAAHYYTRQVYIGDVVNEWLTLWFDPPPGLSIDLPVEGLPELAEQLKEATDAEAYTALVTQMWQVIDDQLPYIAVSDGSWLTGLRQALTNFQPQGIGNYLSFTEAELT